MVAANDTLRTDATAEHLKRIFGMSLYIYFKVLCFFGYFSSTILEVFPFLALFYLIPENDEGEKLILERILVVGESHLLISVLTSYRGTIATAGIRFKIIRS